MNELNKLYNNSNIRIIPVRYEGLDNFITQTWEVVIDIYANNTYSFGFQNFLFNYTVTSAGTFQAMRLSLHSQAFYTTTQETGQFGVYKVLITVPGQYNNNYPTTYNVVAPDGKKYVYEMVRGIVNFTDPSEYGFYIDHDKPFFPLYVLQTLANQRYNNLIYQKDPYETQIESQNYFLLQNDNYLESDYTFSRSIDLITMLCMSNQEAFYGKYYIKKAPFPFTQIDSMFLDTEGAAQDLKSNFVCKILEFNNIGK